MTRFRGGGQEKKIASALMKQLNKVAASAVQNAAVQITNGLVDAGPAWSGEFSASWDVVAIGDKPSQPRGTGRIYRYDKRNFPLSRFEKALEKGIKQFAIVNSSPHASIAIDSVESEFRHPNDEDPLKDPVEFGFRPKEQNGDQIPSFRYDINLGYDAGERPDSMITAEADWLVTYALGGELNRDLGRGVSIGFNGIL